MPENDVVRPSSFSGPVPAASARSAFDIVVLVAAALTLILVLSGSLLRPYVSLTVASAIAPLDPSAPIVTGSGFIRDAVYPATPLPAVESRVERFGSWVGSDETMGQVQSRWYHAASHVSLLVVGYPDGQSRQLFLEGLNAQGDTERLFVTPVRPPGEKWVPAAVDLPRSWTRFRIVAIDHAPGFEGWLGFSEPITLDDSLLELAKQYFLLLLSAAGTFVLLLGPGLLLRIRKKSRPLAALYLLPLPGLLYAICLGLLAWKGPLFLHPSMATRIGVGLLAAVLLYAFRRRRNTAIVSSTECRVLFILLLLAVIAISKATYSLGPEGELYGGEISRSLEVGARSDSRINYHIVQMVASRDHAYGPITTSLLAPWNFSHRGPIAGLAASAIVLSTPTKPSTHLPDAAWQIFDREGFAAYRVAMIVISCCLLLPVFGLLRLFLPDAQALLAFLVVAGAPFIIHEIYFTWPKIISAGLVVISACLACQRRYFQSGLLLGLGYLGHPSALLSCPAIFSLVLLRVPSVRAWFAQWKGITLGWVQQSAGLGIFLFFWRFVNGRHYAQDGFVQYLKMAENLPPTVPNWLFVRGLSLRNTLVPFHLFFFDSQNTAIVLIGAPPAILTFFIQDWTSLPSGTGLLLYPCLIYWMILGWRHARAWLVLIVILPLAFFSLYWGNVTTGMLRDGLHCWVIGALCFGGWCWQALGGNSKRWWRYASLALLFRGVETVCMLIVPAIVANHGLFSAKFALNDILSLAAMLTACAVLYLFTFQLSEQLRRTGRLTISETRR